MEDPSLAVVEEEEDFYERIEAPKFVDFTIPDSSRPDHRSWFCARIGCDQKHEEIDPNELNRSFMLRVMAARSPNVRFQRALNKQGSRANIKCPQSAPAKSTKNGISRMSTMNSIKEKITMSKLKQHPITSLRETPIQKKAKLPTLTSEKKNTTAGNKKSEAKHPKSSNTVVASKDRNSVKALFSHTPNKAAGSSKETSSKIFSEKKKKINTISSNRMKGSFTSSKKTSAVGSKNTNHSILKEAEHIEMRYVQIVVESKCSDNLVENKANVVKRTVEENLVITDSKIVCGSEVSIKPSKDEVENRDLKVSNGAINEIKTACNVTNDDDKENTSFTFVNKNLHPNVAVSEVKSLQFQNSNPQEVQNKAFQAVKLKRTTNPKPFRLRTDERGILKEANLERKLKVDSKKEPATVLNNIQETNSQAKLARSTQTRKLNSKKAKTIQESHCKIFKMASKKQLLKTTSAGEEKRESISRMLKEKEGLIKLRDRTAERRAGYPQGRKPATIPKEPKFHRIHVPKNCIRRFEMAVS